MSPFIAVVSCGKKKLGHPTIAKRLYLGNYFSAVSAWMERNCRQWVILSARYGVVRPTQVIAPYDMTTKSMTAEELRAWAGAVRCSLGREYKGCTFMAIIGRQYRLALDGLACVFPLDEAGVTDQRFGYAVQWMKQNPVWRTR